MAWSKTRRIFPFAVTVPTLYGCELMLLLGSRGLQAISVLHATIAAGLIAGAGLFIFPWREKN
jgi:hypothetical protein